MYSGTPGKESFEECPEGCLPGFSNIANFRYPDWSEYVMDEGKSLFSYHGNEILMM